MASAAAGPGRRQAAWSRLGPALALVFAAAPAFFWGGSYVDVEAVGLLEKYWGGRSFLQYVFDPRGSDFYRSRELSYAFDFLDAQWVRLLLERDVVFFLAPTAVLASLALVLLVRGLGPRALPGLGGRSRWLALLVLLSSFVFLSTMGIYYRATKSLVAPLLLGLLLLVLAEHRSPRLGARARFAAVFGTGLAMSLLDHEGLFYLLVLALVLAAVWVRTRRDSAPALGAAAAALAWLAYSQALGPWIIHRVNGYWPDMGFQHLQPGGLLDPAPWTKAASILGDWTSVLLGGLPPCALAVALAASAAVGAWRARGSPRRFLLAAAVVLAAALAQLTMVAIMVKRHPPMTWTGNRLWYYPLPYQVLVTFGLLMGAERLARRGGSWRRLLPVALGALVVANVARWPELAQSMHEEPAFAEQQRRSTLLVRSLRGRVADPLLDENYRRFYFECLDRFPRLAERAAPQVGEGVGTDATSIRDGRLVARADRQAHVVPRTHERGRYVLAGAAVLRPGDALLVLRGGRLPRLLAEVRPDPERAGPTFFRLEVDLGAGRNDILLRTERSGATGEGSRRARAGFTLLLPIALWPEPAATPSRAATP
jgi:hypothetical protein